MTTDMTDPTNYGGQPAQPYGQQYPRSEQPAQSQYGQQYPQSGTHAAQPYSQYGGQQPEQYGKHQYGQQQYGQQQYGGYQSSYGYGGMTAPKRPGIATAVAILGIVLGVIFGLWGAGVLIAAAAGSDSSMSGFSFYGGGLAVTWIWGLLMIAGSVAMFVGAIMTLSGSNLLSLRAGAVALALSWVIVSIYGIANGGGSATAFVFLVIFLIPPALVIGLSLSKSIATWQSKKQAWVAAGGEA